MNRVCYFVLLLATTVLPTQAELTDFGKMRSRLQPELALKSRESLEAPVPPPGLELVEYTAPLGRNVAYLSPAPRKRVRLPLVIWLGDGFHNSITSRLWNARAEGPQVELLCESGFRVLIPSLRGGNLNPGLKEGLLGEVDDVIAAAKYGRDLPGVDPKRVYLIGHGTGGTLAGLTSASSRGLFRAIFAYEAAHEAGQYSRQSAVFSFAKQRQREARSIVAGLPFIHQTTFFITSRGQNLRSLQAIEEASRNAHVSCVLARQLNPENVSARTLAEVLEEIRRDTGKECGIRLDERILAGLPSEAGVLPEENIDPAWEVVRDLRDVRVFTDHPKGRFRVFQQARLEGPWGHLPVRKVQDGERLRVEQPTVVYSYRRQVKAENRERVAALLHADLLRTGKRTPGVDVIKRGLSQDYVYTFRLIGRRANAGDAQTFREGVRDFAKTMKKSVVQDISGVAGIGRY